MKKFYLKFGLYLIIIFHCDALWASPDFFNNYTHYFSYEKNSFTTGLKIDLSLAEGRFGIDKDCNYNYGISVFSDNYLKKFPMKCQAGNLSIGGIISKFKDPGIDSSASAFGGCYSDPTIITSTLPSYSSFTKPFSVFVEAGWENEKTFFKNITFNCAYTPETENLSFSGKVKIGFTENFNITNSSGLNIYKIKENKSSSWYLPIPYYNESGSFCLGEQFSISLFNFSSNFSVFCYKSPFAKEKKWEKIENIYRTESKFENDNFKIGISALFNNFRNIISPENKVLKPGTQLKTNIQYKNDFGKNNDYSIKAGLTAYGYFNAEHNSQDDLKFGIATAASFPLSQISAEGTFNYKFVEQSKNIILKFVSASICNIWNIGFFSPELIISSQYYIPDKDYNNSRNINRNYTINLNLNFWSDIITNSNSFSFSVKENNVCNKKIKTSVNFNFSYKKLLISGKIAGEFCL